jgi:hypothetical protein
MARQDDWWTGARGAIFVLLGLATGTAVVQQRSSPGTKPSERAEVRAQATPETAAGTGTRSNALAGVRPVISLLATALGVDLEDTAVRRAAIAWRDALSLKLGSKPHAAELDAIAALDSLLGSLDDQSPQSPGRSGAPSSADRRLSVDEALRVVSAYGASDARADSDERRQRAALLDYFANGGRDASSIAWLEKRAADRRLRLRPLIVTLPDYIDSHGGRLFDSGLAGIQEAAGALGYALDRFYLADWDEAPRPNASRTRHETEPGAVLFRNTHANPDVDELLLVLVVTETATAGVHKAAFSAAANFVSEWNDARTRRDGSPPDEELAVLGPFFSGSTPSLRLALDNVTSSRRPGLASKIRVLTGTATSPSNLALLTSSPESGRTLTFGATVRNDEEVSLALYDELVSLNPSWRLGRQVALLVEANTAYGQNLQRSGALSGEPDTSSSIASRVAARHPECGTLLAGAELGEDNTATETVLQLFFPDDRMQRAFDSSRCVKNTAAALCETEREQQKRKPCRVESKRGFLHALSMRFPLNISRVRETSTAAVSEGLRSSPFGLLSPESSSRRDQLPVAAPDLTAAVVDIALRNILAALRREHVTAVGVFATDARDHLFLAREISRAIPNALMFGTQTDLLYLNPEFAPFLKGTIVAASYPLFNETQLAMPPRMGPNVRHQFTIAAEQGIYNAAIALIKRLGTSSQASAQLVDYGRANERCQDAPCRPPVWLSVVGEDALWPLAAVTPYNPQTTPRDYTLPLRSEDAGPSPAAHTSSWAAGASFIVLLVVWFFGAGYLLMRLQADPAKLHCVSWNRRQKLKVLIDAWLESKEPAPVTVSAVRQMFAARSIAISERLERPTDRRFSSPLAMFAVPSLGNDPDRARLLERGIDCLWEKVVDLSRAGRKVQDSVDLQSITAAQLTEGLPGGWAKSVRLEKHLPTLVTQVRNAAMLRLSPVRRRADQAYRGYLLSAYVSLALAAAWVLVWMRVWALDRSTSDWHLLWRWLSIVTSVAVIAPIIGLSWDLWRHRLPLQRSLWSPQRAQAQPSVPLARIAFLVRRLLWWPLRGMVRSGAFWCIFGSLVPWIAFLGLPLVLEVPRAPALYTAGGSALIFTRYASLTSGVSPTPAVVGFATLMWLLAMWSMRRLKMHAYRQPHGGWIKRVLTSGNPDFARKFHRALLEFAPWVPPGSPYLLLPCLIGLLALAGGWNKGVTVEGSAFTRAFWWSEAIAITAVAQIAARAAYQGRMLRIALNHLALHDLAGELDNIAKNTKLFDWGLWLRPQRRMTLAPLIKKVKSLRGKLAADFPLPTDRRLALQGAMDDLLGLPPVASRPNNPVIATDDWTGLLRVSAELMATLEQFYWKTPRPVDPTGFFKEAQVVVGYQLCFVIRNLLARVVTGFTAALIGFLILMVGFLAYSFQGRYFWLGLAGTGLTMTAVLTCWLLIQLERDFVLSKLWKTDPGRISWTSGFVYRIAITGALPILIWLSAIFPEVAGSLGALLGPLQKTLP